MRSSARATSIIVIAHSRRSASVAGLDRALEHLPVEAVDLLVLAREVLGERNVAQQERLLRLADLERASAPIFSMIEELIVHRRLVARDREELGDVHALVAHPLGVADDLQERGHDAQVGGHRGLQGEQGQDPLVDLEVAAVDPVVVGDHERGELDVAMPERLQRAIERVTTRSSAPSACSSSRASSS